MKATVVLTTVNQCEPLVEGYLANFAHYGHDANIILIPDVKTPSLCLPNEVQIPTIYEQEKFLDGVGFPHEEVPRNSDNRRNVGYLMALAQGADVVISIDDDNWCLEHDDFIGQHSIVSEPRLVGWYDPCSDLDGPGTGYVDARGFPKFARKQPPQRSRATVRINAGLWLGDPDLDGITWMTWPKTKATSLTGCNFLDTNEWAPINSQNTAVAREAMAAYYYLRMDPPMDRFGDIFQGYFALACLKALGCTARFGTPVVDHRRNSHNYAKDAAAECPAIALNEELLPKLVTHRLAGTSVADAYLSLADFIESQGGDFYTGTAKRMRLWVGACRRIGV